MPRSFRTSRSRWMRRFLPICRSRSMCWSRRMCRPWSTSWSHSISRSLWSWDAWWRWWWRRKHVEGWDEELNSGDIRDQVDVEKEASPRWKWQSPQELVRFRQDRGVLRRSVEVHQVEEGHWGPAALVCSQWRRTFHADLPVYKEGSQRCGRTASHPLLHWQWRTSTAMEGYGWSLWRERGRAFREGR